MAEGGIPPRVTSSARRGSSSSEDEETRDKLMQNVRGGGGSVWDQEFKTPDRKIDVTKGQKLNGIRTKRKGVAGTLFYVTVPMETGRERLFVIRNEVPIFVPDTADYTPVHVPKYTVFGGHHTQLKGTNKVMTEGVDITSTHGFWFYPPPQKGQKIRGDMKVRTKFAATDIDSRIVFDDGPSTGADLVVTKRNIPGSIADDAREMVYRPRAHTTDFSVVHHDLPKHRGYHGEDRGEEVVFQPRVKPIEVQMNPGKCKRSDGTVTKHNGGAAHLTLIFYPVTVKKGSVYEPVTIVPYLITAKLKDTEGHDAFCKLRNYKEFEYRYYPPRVPRQEIPEKYRIISNPNLFSDQERMVPIHVSEDRVPGTTGLPQNMPKLPDVKHASSKGQKEKVSFPVILQDINGGEIVVDGETREYKGQMVCLRFDSMYIFVPRTAEYPEAGIEVQLPDFVTLIGVKLRSFPGQRSRIDIQCPTPIEVQAQYQARYYPHAQPGQKLPTQKPAAMARLSESNKHRTIIESKGKPGVSVGHRQWCNQNVLKNPEQIAKWKSKPKKQPFVKKTGISEFYRYALLNRQKEEGRDPALFSYQLKESEMAARDQRAFLASKEAEQAAAAPIPGPAPPNPTSHGEEIEVISTEPLEGGGRSRSASVESTTSLFRSAMSWVGKKGRAIKKRTASATELFGSCPGTPLPTLRYKKEPKEPKSSSDEDVAEGSSPEVTPEGAAASPAPEKGSSEDEPGTGK